MERIDDQTIISHGINRAVEELKESAVKNKQKEFEQFDYYEFSHMNYDKKREYISEYMNWYSAPNLWDPIGKNLLPDLRDSEKLLYTTDKFYRDHLYLNNNL